MASSRKIEKRSGGKKTSSRKGKQVVRRLAEMKKILNAMFEDWKMKT